MDADERVAVALERIAEAAERQEKLLEKVASDLELVVDRDGGARRARLMRVAEKVLPNLITSFLSGPPKRTKPNYE